jgi:phosphoribosylglycinamide formyltransferase-1
VVARRPDEVTAALRTYGAQWVAMCGYMRFWDPPTPWKGRTLNVHPALLPAFGGQGMFGHHVHEAVLRHGCKVSGCTVHLVDGAYDTGPILDQAAVRIDDGETPDSLAAKVQAAERALYPQVLARLIQADAAHRTGP